MPRLMLFYAFVLLLFPWQIMALDNQDSQYKDVETVVVSGKKPLQYLFKLKEQKRTAFMTLFNELVADEDMHFECRLETPTGSHIRKRTCRNVFDWRIIQEIVEDEYRRGNIYSAYSVALMGNKEQREKRKELLALVNELLDRSPSFSALFNEFNSAKEAYQKAHIKKFRQFSPYAKSDEPVK